MLIEYNRSMSIKSDSCILIDKFSILLIYTHQKNYQQSAYLEEIAMLLHFSSYLNMATHRLVICTSLSNVLSIFAMVCSTIFPISPQECLVF